MVTPPDIELWLCEWLRSNIKDVTGLQVGNREPEDYRGEHPLIVVRDAEEASRTGSSSTAAWA